MSFRRFLVVVCAIVLQASVATARKPVVVIAPFRGPEVAAPVQVIARALKRRALVLSPVRYSLVAKGLVATNQTAEDIAAVAKELGAAWVITGTTRAEGARWALSITLRDGATGRSRAKLRYALTSPRVPRMTLKTIGREIVEAFVAAVSSPPPREHPEEETPPPPTRENPPTAKEPPRSDLKKPPPVDDDETPPSRPGNDSERHPKKVEPKVEDEPRKLPHDEPKDEPKRMEEPKRVEEPRKDPPVVASNKRPRWAPYFDISLGGILTGRSFSVDPPPPKFSSSVVGGMRGDLTLYPLAGTWSKARGIFAGLGLGVTLEKPFWPDSTSKNDPTQRFPTTEIKVEGGLRWKLTLYKPMPRPQLHLIVEGGFHDFAFAKGANGTDIVGVPDTHYIYASLGGGLSIHFAEWSWLWVKFVYHIASDVGPIQYPENYGLAVARGFRFTGGLDFLAYKGFRLGLMGMYERWMIIFGYDPANRTKVADGATDEYYGGMLLLGYVL